MNEFTGSALPFSDDAVHDAADTLGCDVAAIRAVMDVESRGGFLRDRRPKILFERHVFSRLTGGKYDATHPDLSSRIAGGYNGGAAEHERLERAIKLDRAAAIKSASWGAFQVMGYHHATLGWPEVDDFCTSMCRSEDEHLGSFVRFVQAKGLADELCRRDWAGFARGYNGPAFAKNHYDTKLSAAYALHSLSPPRTEAIERTLKMGHDGQDVEWLQRKLGTAVDGDFGPATKTAVIAFQKARGLRPDGIVGSSTRRALKNL